MAMRLALLGFALATISPAIARSVEYRWTSGPDMGGQITAAIENAGTHGQYGVLLRTMATDPAFAVNLLRVPCCCLGSIIDL